MEIAAYWGGSYQFKGKTKENIRTFRNCRILQENENSITITMSKTNNPKWEIKKDTIISMK